MSHIITSDEEIKIVSQYLDILRTKGYSKDSLYEILTDIIPKNQMFQVVPEIDTTGYTAYFSGYDKKIHINHEKMKNYVEKAVEWITNDYPKLKTQKEELKAYLTLFVLSHEVEHVYQYLIGKELIDFPYKIVIELYKNIANYNYKENINSIWLAALIERYKQQKDKAKFVLERNANVEAYEMLSKSATYENNSDLFLFLNNQYLWYSVCGYLKIKNNGPFEESYRNIWRHGQYKSFDFTEEIPFEERIRYGLPLDYEPRKELLKKFLDTKGNH